MLKDKLQLDQKEGLKTGDAQKRLVIGMILNAVKNKELEKRSKLSKTVSNSATPEKDSALSDEEVIDVIMTEVKKRKESSDLFRKGGREDLAKKEEDELKLLMSYLPEQMDENSIRVIVQDAIKDTGASGPKDMGKVIGVVMPKIKGRAEGQVVSKIVKELLS